MVVVGSSPTGGAMKKDIHCANEMSRSSIVGSKRKLTQTGGYDRSFIFCLIIQE